MLNVKNYIYIFNIPRYVTNKKKVENVSMFNYEYKQQFKENLVAWFDSEKRDLPWRHTKEPYKIWVSEVMLQQTRVDTVIPYYNRFTEKYPTIHDLANAPEEELLKMWEGLGYYSRVRNLQAGVKEVVEQYGGIVPKTRSEISQLKGVGPYTAGAVLSIAYGVPEHAVDGNVMRVLSRVLNIDADIALPKTKKIFEEAVMMLIDKNNPSSFNQGLMELGALICTPTSPKCLLCPVRENCMAFQYGDPSSLPIKSKKTKTKTITYKVFVAVDAKGNVLVEKRSSDGLLANMWQFPMIEQKDEAKALQKFKKQYGVKLEEGMLKLLEFKHVFSHLVWEIESYLVYVESFEQFEQNTLLVSQQQLEQLPLPVPMQKIKQAFFAK